MRKQIQTPLRTILVLFVIIFGNTIYSQKFKAVEDTTLTLQDSVINIREVPITRFRNPDDEMEYFKDLSRIRKVLPYVKMAKILYKDMESQKQDNKKKEYRKFRKNTEKEMRDKFEKELKDLTIGQGKVLVKLINRETGNNCYDIIKEIKNPVSAWGWQIVAKHWGYNLKEQYDPKKEWILELAIKAVGEEYKVD